MRVAQLIGQFAALSARDLLLIREGLIHGLEPVAALPLAELREAGPCVQVIDRLLAGEDIAVAAEPLEAMISAVAEAEGSTMFAGVDTVEDLFRRLDGVTAAAPPLARQIHLGSRHAPAVAPTRPPQQRPCRCRRLGVAVGQSRLPTVPLGLADRPAPTAEHPIEKRGRLMASTQDIIDSHARTLRVKGEAADAAARAAVPAGPDTYRRLLDQLLEARSVALAALVAHVAETDPLPPGRTGPEGVLKVRLEAAERAVHSSAATFADFAGLHPGVISGAEHGALADLASDGPSLLTYEQKADRWKASRPVASDAERRAQAEATKGDEAARILDEALRRRLTVMATLRAEMAAEPPPPRYYLFDIARQQRAESRLQRRDAANATVGRAALSLLRSGTDLAGEEKMALTALGLLTNAGDPQVDIDRQVARWRAAQPAEPPTASPNTSRWRRS